VARSFKQAGEELFPFVGFPRSQGKPLRTTNAFERINEFRRRTKTKPSLPSRDAVVLLLGLLRAGYIRIGKIDGWQEMALVTAAVAA
jgi:transposase-like protein